MTGFTLLTSHHRDPFPSQEIAHHYLSVYYQWMLVADYSHNTRLSLSQIKDKHSYEKAKEVTAIVITYTHTHTHTHW